MQKKYINFHVSLATPIYVSCDAEVVQTYILFTWSHESHGIS